MPNAKTKAAKPAAAAESEAEYTAAELAKNAKTVFGPNVSPDIVTAALRMAGATKTTLRAAQKTVKEFLEKEVK